MKRGLPFALLVLALAAPAWLPGEIVDRIVATVGDRLITLSDVQEAYRFECLMNRAAPQQLDGARVRQVADRLIEQTLLEQEMESSRFQRAGAEEINRRVAEINNAFGGEEAYRRALQDCGLEEEGLRRTLERQANIGRFIDLRFRPGVQVDEPAIERYYRDVLVPQLSARQNGKVPDLNDVRERIEEVLVQERINQEYSAWVKDLRTQTQIRFR